MKVAKYEIANEADSHFWPSLRSVYTKRQWASIKKSIKKVIYSE